MAKTTRRSSTAYAPERAQTSLPDRLRQALAPNLLLVRELGAGGMARVFLAREPALKRLVAVKVMSGDLAADTNGRTRFEREAQAVAGLSHPNVVAVHSVGELGDGTPYFVMQFVDGRSLASRVEKEGPMPIAEARRAIGEIAAALAAAHKQGIVHRDIKPANILCEESTGRALVSDFGIAAIGRDTSASLTATQTAVASTKLTATGMIVGTPQYMSPEQLTAEQVTEKTDVYSLGLLAHELLSGASPFKGSTPQELIASHLRDVAPPLRAARPDVDAELDAIVARCLEKDPNARPSADEVAKRLLAGGNALLEWPPPGLEELHGRLRRVSRLFMLGGAMVTAATVIILAAGPTLSAATGSPSTLALLGAALLGAFALVAATQRAVEVARLTKRALKGGYAWSTVLETMADVRGDTGNLISASREYAGLSPELRDLYRRGRVRREIALSLGGFLALPLFLAVVMFAGGTASMWWIGTIAVAPPIFGLALAFRVEQREYRAFASHRARRVARDVSGLAAPWYETFEAVRQGQRVGRGISGPKSAGTWAAIAAAVVMLVVVMLFLPLTVIGTVGPEFWATVAPQYADTESKTRLVSVMRPYDLPNDSAVTPMDAGRALVRSVGPATRRIPGAVEHSIAGLPTPPWERPIPDGVLLNARYAEIASIPSPLTIISAARAGLNARDVAHLERIAAAPQWKHFDILAQARTFDYIGARFRLPVESGHARLAFVSPDDAKLRGLAYASVSRAAYHMIGGRRDSAEAALRATIAVGFLFIDQGNLRRDQSSGATLVGIGRDGLLDLFEATNDPRGAALQARHDSALAVYDRESTSRPTPFMNVNPGDPAMLRTVIMRRASDAGEYRAIRISMLAALGLAPCTNLRELLFGPSQELRDLFAAQRDSLVRFPSDQLLLDGIDRASERIDQSMPQSLPVRMAVRIGETFGLPRIGGCAATLSFGTGMQAAR